MQIAPPTKCNNGLMNFSAPFQNQFRTIGRYWLLLSSVFYTLTIFARSWHALGRYPSDPGYDYFLDAMNKGPSVIFSRADIYLHVLPRIIVEVVVWFPIEWHAIITGILINILWVACGICIASVVYLETRSRKFAMFCGLILLIVPTAMMSSLVNIGNVKWPFLTAILVACCSQRVLQEYPRWLVAGLFLLGLSNPLAIVAALPLFVQALTKVGITRRMACQSLIALFTTLLIQLFVVGIDAASRGRGSARVFALSNLGSFWRFGLLSPVCLALVVIAMGMIPAFRKSPQHYFWSLLSVTTVILSLASYIFGGIADRYFVAPMALSWLAGALLLRQMAVTLPRVGRLLAVTALLLFAAPTAKWFRAGSYLTSGRTWSDQIYDARQLCKTGTTSYFEMSFTYLRTERYECTYLSNDK